MTDADRPTSRPIVVGVDGSDESKAALRWAFRQAAMTGAAMRAVMSWHIPMASYGAPMMAISDYDFGGESTKVLEAAIEDVSKDYPQVKVTTAVEEGMPAPILLEASAGASLLVVGSRGHGAFSGMLLGSVSEHCVTHATCPVVVVRHGLDTT